LTLSLYTSQKAMVLSTFAHLEKAIDLNVEIDGFAKARKQK